MQAVSQPYHVYRVPRHMPVPGRYWADAGSIEPERGQFWHVYRVNRYCRPTGKQMREKCVKFHLKEHIVVPLCVMFS